MTEPEDRIYNFYSSFEGGRIEKSQDGSGPRLKLHPVFHDGKELPALEYKVRPIIVSPSYIRGLTPVLEHNDESLTFVLWEKKKDENDFVMKLVTGDNERYYNLTGMTPEYHRDVNGKNRKRRNGQSKKAPKAKSTSHTDGKMCIQCAFLST